jgi:hypothetical protein
MAMAELAKGFIGMIKAFCPLNLSSQRDSSPDLQVTASPLQPGSSVSAEFGVSKKLLQNAIRYAGPSSVQALQMQVSCERAYRVRVDGSHVVVAGHGQPTICLVWHG